MLTRGCDNAQTKAASLTPARCGVNAGGLFYYWKVGDRRQLRPDDSHSYPQGAVDTNRGPLACTSEGILADKRHDKTS